ncbi:hypothetical protein FB451DRAFT_1498353 [Mycena latifolia]|nr:hypothetical protein FB451DRAFT_1498353 [Mycena latifolia]
MLVRDKMRNSDTALRPRYWGNGFQEQEPALGGVRDIFQTPTLEFARHAHSTAHRSILSISDPPLCSVVTSMPMPIPTTLSNESSGSSARQVTMVAATTGGAIILVFLVFALIFFRVRSKQRRQELTDTLAREERKGKGAGGMGMLDGEGFESVRGRPPTQIEYQRPQVEYHLHLSPDLERRAQDHAERAPTLRYTALPPFLFPRRASDSGSAFREEVWPPPRQESVFVDPLLHAPAEDLSRIVTDIMGQPTGAFSAPSLPAYFSGAGTPQSRRNSCSTISAITPLRSSASTPTLPLSTLSVDSRVTLSDDDPPWPPTPGHLPSSTPPVSFWQRPTTPLFAAQRPPVLASKTPTQLRPSTGDGSPRVKNWLERTPRRLDHPPDQDHGMRRAASEGH